MMWDTIKKGEPFGAYIKNRSKDGRSYWVFAIVTPTLHLIEKEYATLLTVEKDPNLKPAESAQFYVYRLSELGFQDHGTFVASTLAEEIKARDTELGLASTSAAIQFVAVADAAKKSRASGQ